MLLNSAQKFLWLYKSMACEHSKLLYNPDALDGILQAQGSRLDSPFV